jgi:hypothetical protein
MAGTTNLLQGGGSIQEICIFRFENATWFLSSGDASLPFGTPADTSV